MTVVMRMIVVVMIRMMVVMVVMVVRLTSQPPVCPALFRFQHQKF